MRFFKMAVAVDHQHHEFKSFGRPPRCRLQSYSHLDYTMPELISQTNFPCHYSSSLKQAFEVANNIHRSFSTPCLPFTTRLEEKEELNANPNANNSNNPRIEIVSGHSDPRTRALVVEVAIAMASGAVPVPVSSGLSGAYFLRGRNNDTIAVIKPTDEEPLAINNPKGYAAGRMLGQQPGMKRSSIRIGETGLRELAAYLLDHGGFAGVPPTALVKISHVASFHVNVNNSNSSEEELANILDQSPPSCKIASLQRFVDHDSDAGDLGPSGFSVSSIHCIGILDIRILNLDRHAGNMLVKQGHGHGSSYADGAAELVPIDHGLCLPESLDDPYFEWLHWPQASVPFSDSEVEYILNLDPFKDAQLLRKELPSIRESSIRVLVLCTIFLKQAVSAGLCLDDIGEMMTRDFHGGEENLSVLENLCLNAKGMASTCSSILNSDSTNEIDDYQSEVIDTEIFQLDNEWEDNSSQALDLPCKLLQTPPTVIGRPPRITRSMSGLLPSQDEEVCGVHNNDDNDSGGSNEYKVWTGLIRSKSCSASNYNHENGGISFEEINEEEWELFLENFEKLLPGVFEGRKSMGLVKQRLGTSCQF
ncbi:hypothetical protein CsSME_00046022 [Camellia sinensis var. sinensis]|uniref:1-phosphatidylinositol 4-kinase n=1 Tax=Camellia sinensis var. sinensis TaxID=542762 RepID=A0A4S4EEA9_CAMSN|nr:phosphatidylinositol 4-kinase gamma 8-like [Camellia sinensis]XP_028069339.1 phosphatidylinositol 4-kinase gamma 8-like [Camellia sinensis]XP_028069340.1 phosphatidylinositol 4-kinase gamma 8-like [Camellia sinensis]XP_028069341.1 phosphatidylinositol 4-kinase gamma 8-like [Camellia sinensis]XP_028069342.1 phosphatidylinositol 4-kinase gamma 8-like [Camellia sinensis]THG14710.1 hypothetical protein TEA_015641 [Camellia sinensis var. sinensis]